MYFFNLCYSNTYHNRFLVPRLRQEQPEREVQDGGEVGRSVLVGQVQRNQLPQVGGNEVQVQLNIIYIYIRLVLIF